MRAMARFRWLSKKCLHPCDLDESSLSIGRVNLFFFRCVKVLNVMIGTSVSLKVGGQQQLRHAEYL